MTEKSYSALKSQPPKYQFTTNSYDTFQIIFIETGELHFKCFDKGNEVNTILVPGNFLLLRKNSCFSLSSPYTGYSGICYLDYLPEREDFIGYSFFFVGTQWFIELTELLGHLLLNPESNNSETTRLIGRSIAVQALSEKFSNKLIYSQTADKYWCNQIKHIIQNSLYRTHKEYYEQIHSLNLSYRQLSRIFLKETGMSIKSYQTAKRIKEAKRLLHSTGFSITDIAFELHYASSQKFAYYFRKETGMTPTDFRNNKELDAR
ncbi:MAG: hypothetical protein DRP58_05890 [Spirochaetes bacterium]|nr:MAG: hypothetical protein DRP58_05890 [Spirochaetota bacterium]